MNSVFHRRVQVIVSNGHSNPQVSGYEEIYQNGRREIRTGGDRDLGSLINAPVDRGTVLPQTASPSAWDNVKAIANQSYRKVKRVIQNVPVAFQTALRELNR